MKEIKKEPYAELSNIIELAHQLTVREYSIRGTDYNALNRSEYRTQAKKIHDNFVALITNILKIKINAEN